MSLLQQIQEAVINDETDISSVLLKLQLLAAKLGSEELEEWVKFESQGYPSNVEVPTYRKISISYVGTFSGPFGSGVRNAPIPSYLIEKFAGDNWTRYELRDSIAVIDDLFKSSSDGEGSLGIDASNLMLLLQGKIYEDLACNEIKGTFSRSSLAELKHAVRSKILKLTIELEKSIPSSLDIEFGSKVLQSNEVTSREVTQLSQQIIYGNVTSINSSGDGAQFLVAVDKGDSNALKEYLINSGIIESDVDELVEIVQSEEAGDSQEPLGDKAKEWLINNLKKATDGTWKIGVSVATQVIKEALLKYYGLK